MEAGHAAQNIYLQAVPLQLGTVVIGAFQDEEVKRLLKMRVGESPLYIMPVGKKISMLNTTVSLKTAGRGRGDEKSLTLRHLKRSYYGPPVQKRNPLTVRLP